MNREETSKILSYLKAAYPSSFKDMCREDMMKMMSIWERRFRDIPAELVFMAVDELIEVSKFPPSVAEVAEHLVGMYWDNLVYVGGIKHNTILLTDAEKEWVLYVDRVLEGFAKNKDAPMLTGGNETKLLGG